MSAENKSVLFTIDKCIANYTNKLFNPSVSEFSKDGNPEWQVCLMFPKNDDSINPLKKCLSEIEKSIWKDKLPRFKHPLIKDGDETEKQGLSGYWYLWAKQNKAPHILNYNKTKITDQSVLYSGSIVKAVVKLFPYSGVNNGISCYLAGVQKIGEGEPLYSGDDIDLDTYFDEVTPQADSTEMESFA